MSLPDRPANENKKLGEPGYLSPRAQRIETVLSLIGLALGFAFTLAVLDARHWITVAVIVGAGFVVMLAVGLWRALMGGRA